jgi:hypothetical protein
MELKENGNSVGTGRRLTPAGLTHSIRLGTVRPVWTGQAEKKGEGGAGAGTGLDIRNSALPSRSW